MSHPVSRTLCWAVVGICLLAGCVPSIHPLYEPGQTTYRPELVGIWVAPDQSSSWMIDGISDSSYRLTIFSSDGTGAQVWNAHLVELDGHLYLDAARDLKHVNPDESWHGTVVPLHALFRVRLTSDRLYLDIINQQWLEEYLREQPHELAVTTLNNQLIITSETDSLQQFVIRHSHAGLFHLNNTGLQRQ